MVSRRKDVLDIREILRRLKLGQSVREIARELEMHRKTVRQYRKIAQAEGWLARLELPTLAEIHAAISARSAAPPSGPPSCVEPYREKILRLRHERVEAVAIWQILRDEGRFLGSYSSVLRFVRKLEPRTPSGTARPMRGSR